MKAYNVARAVVIRHILPLAICTGIMALALGGIAGLVIGASNGGGAFWAGVAVSITLNLAVLAGAWYVCLRTPLVIDVHSDGTIEFHAALGTVSTSAADITSITECLAAFLHSGIKVRSAARRTIVMGFPEDLREFVATVHELNPEMELGPWRRLRGHMVGANG